MQYLLEEFLTTYPNREIAFSDDISVNEMRQFRIILRHTLSGKQKWVLGKRKWVAEATVPVS